MNRTLKKILLIFFISVTCIVLVYYFYNKNSINRTNVPKVKPPASVPRRPIRYVLTTPTVISPGDKEIIRIQQGDSICVSWNYVTGANQYKVEFYSIKDRKKSLILKERISENGMCIDKLRQGEYVWFLRAESKNQKGRVIKRSRYIQNIFTIMYKKQKPKISTLTIEEI